MLKQVHIINEAVVLPCAMYISVRKHTGRVMQGEGWLTVHTTLFRGKIVMTHLPKKSLPCGSDYIATFVLK